MELTPAQITKILDAAWSLLGRPYADDFQCVDFVRAVYASADITIPRLTSGSPPEDFNIRKADLRNPPAGYIMFLKDRCDPRKERLWTHLVIILPLRTCIHCSLFYGEKVVITPLAEIFERYDFAESKTLPI